MVAYGLPRKFPTVAACQCCYLSITGDQLQIATSDYNWGCNMARQRGYDQQAHRGPNQDVDRQQRWQARQGSSRNHEEFGEPDEWQEPSYGQEYYDELPDGGRGIYTNDERPSRSNERAHQFVETVYGPQRESYLPHRSWYRRMQRGSGSNYSNVDYENGDYTRSPSARSRYGESYAENRPGYGHSDVVSSNWSRTAGSGEWAPDAKSSAQQQVSTYRGKGPKGYERSAERLKELVCERLTEAPYLDASDITVEG